MDFEKNIKHNYDEILNEPKTNKISDTTINYELNSNSDMDNLKNGIISDQITVKTAVDDIGHDPSIYIGELNYDQLNGNLVCDGNLVANSISPESQATIRFDMSASEIVFNFDGEYIEERFKRLDNTELEFFKHHLQKLILRVEKEQLDRC